MYGSEHVDQDPHKYITDAEHLLAHAPDEPYSMKSDGAKFSNMSTDVTVKSFWGARNGNDVKLHFFE
jgi:hypothetical protein